MTLSTITDYLKGLGIIGIFLLILTLILLPLIITIIIGCTLADMLGFTGLIWWAFVILFYLVVSSILSKTNS